MRKSLYGKVIPCPLCKSSQYCILYPSTLTKEDFQYATLVKNMANTSEDYTKHTQIVRCRKCSLVYTNPREDISKLSDAYEDVVDDEYLKTEKYRKILLFDHLQFVSRVKKRGRILDVGSFAGYFLELAKEKGWEVYGIEPSLWASELAKKKGIKDLGRDIYSVKLKGNFFDAITLWDVIEHLPDPHRLIKIMSKALKKDGVIAIGTPNIDSLYAKILGPRCPFLIRMHIVLYSLKTLQKLLEENGFRIVSMVYYGRTYPIIYIIDRVQVKSIFLKKSLQFFKKIPVIPNIQITHNFHDSIRIIAKKV